MLKILCLIVASALLIEATPIDSQLGEAAKNGNWDAFNSFLRQFTQNSWVPALAANVEDLKPSDGTHVYGHAVSSYKEWQNDNGKVSETGRGEEIINNDGQISKHEFKP
ncbi:uncharacterized protein LOC123655814 [Melitaea cinxia]|uniref:uncharacterized protein LOC123655814 n=1 Tax=Melitaea cinxia TaxID=113334 RepID=UPI001E26EBED|nr:uncharacterized protein LOC123655814 [Melitaea cinxia]